MIVNNGYQKLNEGGFAPLIVSIVIIVVLSLITVGFVLLMNENQQNETNRQLGDAAYYAAQTGVNDAVKAINSGFLTSAFGGVKNSCGTIAFPYLTNNQVNESGQPKTDFYSCLLINPAPDSL